MTHAIFRYVDIDTVAPFTRGEKDDWSFEGKPWSRADADAPSFRRTEKQSLVLDARDLPELSDVDVSGFALVRSRLADGAHTKDFSNDGVIRSEYYREVEELLRDNLPGPIRKVIVYDHTIRKNDPLAPRKPVRAVHVDQTPRAAENRVRRHVPDVEEAEELIRSGRRYQLINVWRPIGHPALEYPLAVVDWRSTVPEDLIPLITLYPKNHNKGKERLPDPSALATTDAYEAKGETYGVLPSENHRFYYYKGMEPDEALFIKQFDSWGDSQPGGKPGVADYALHTAFIDPSMPENVKPRHSIEAYCLVFYDDDDRHHNRGIISID